MKIGGTECQIPYLHAFGGSLGWLRVVKKCNLRLFAFFLRFFAFICVSFALHFLRAPGAFYGMPCINESFS